MAIKYFLHKKNGVCKMMSDGPVESSSEELSVAEIDVSQEDLEKIKNCVPFLIKNGIIIFRE